MISILARELSPNAEFLEKYGGFIFAFSFFALFLLPFSNLCGYKIYVKNFDNLLAVTPISWHNIFSYVLLFNFQTVL